METAARIAESRLLALEREVKHLRELYSDLLDQVRDARVTAQMAAEDAYELGQRTQEARAAFRHFQESEKRIMRAFQRRATRRRSI